MTPLAGIDARTSVLLPRDSNQALGIGQFAVDFLAGKFGPGPSDRVLERTRMFHADAFLCGASALALKTNAPILLREEALEYPDPNGATVFGSSQRVKAEKAVVANSAAVREWDSNGTNFGYRPELGHTAGEFGHNDFYPVVIAACQQRGLDGAAALKAMVLVDEIRGRLAEVFSLKSYKLDHVVHGAIASAAVYGALMGATPEQIESAIGQFVAHYIPWRAIRAGKQLSDSKGASAGISSEVAVLCMKRAMKGFVGPRDVFRNPEAIFRFFEPTTEGKERWKEQGNSPFDLVLSHSGDDFAVMGMHFKLGLYEHQSAGALQGLLELLLANPQIVNRQSSIVNIKILAYEPAFGIIGNPAKMDPKTRQSADHSMAYIVATMLRKALERPGDVAKAASTDDLWKLLMLSPYDYKPDATAVFHPVTREIMSKIKFEHGGTEYDAKYPEGIPTSLSISVGSGGAASFGSGSGAETGMASGTSTPQPPPPPRKARGEPGQEDGECHDSGLVMFPAGHARNTSADLGSILEKKFEMLGAIAFESVPIADAVKDRLKRLGTLSPTELAAIYECKIADRTGYE